MHGTARYNRIEGRNPGMWFASVAGCWLAFGLVASLGCQPISLGTSAITEKLVPSNDRQWLADQSKTPSADTEGQQYTLRNIRNCNYLSTEDYVVNYYDRQIELSQVRSVDFIVVPFLNTDRLAHTMVSFGLDDGSYLAVSVEVRKEVGEGYSALKGFGPNYELIYVIGDERDLIGVRAKHWGNQVYVYPSVASAGQAQALFVDIMERVNKLSVEPEFYNSLTNNCTTNLANHVNQVSPERIRYGWKVLLPGFSAEYAYELGLLDQRIPFEDLTEIAHVNDLVESHLNSDQFSKLIRQRRQRIQRYLELHQRHAQLGGDALLDPPSVPGRAMGRTLRRE